MTQKIPNVVAGLEMVEEMERRTAGLLGKAGSLRKMANNAMRYRSNRGNPFVLSNTMLPSLFLYVFVYFKDISTQMLSSY